jgi:hypothetical protein
LGLQGLERRHRCLRPASRATVGLPCARRTERTAIFPPPRVTTTARRSAATDLEVGPPTVGKAPGDVVARCFATALHALRCVPLSRRTRGLRGPSSGAELSTQIESPISLLPFGAVFPDAIRLLPPDVGTPGCLSWGCRRSPLRRARVVESTPGRPLSGLTFGPPPAGDDRVPPSWFRTTSTACSSATVSGCCTRLPTMGFAAFQTLAKSPSRDAVLPFRALLPRHRADTGRIRCRRVAIRPRRRVTTPTPLHSRPCPPAVLPRDRARATIRRPRPRGFPLCREPCRHLALPLRDDPCSPGLAFPPSYDRSLT